MNEKKMNQKEYLKKYLSGEVGQVKKKRKKKNKLVDKATVTIVDDDFDIPKLANATEEELENYALGEDLPQIAGIIDERPPDVIAKESGKWKVMVENEPQIGTNSMHAESSKQLKKPSYSDKNRSSLDISPTKHSSKCLDVSRPQRLKESSKWKSRKSVDSSPKRKSDRDFDASPPRKSKIDSDISATRKSRSITDLSPKRQSDRDSDASPPRKLKIGSDISATRKSRSIADLSSKRKSDRDSDASPPRKPKRDSNISPNPNRRNNFDLPPKKETVCSPQHRSRRTPDFSPKRRVKKSSSASPIRHSRKSNDVSLHRAKQSENFELKSKKSRWDKEETTSRKLNDVPARKTRISEDYSPPRTAKRISDSSPIRLRKLSPQNYRKNAERDLTISGHSRSNHSPDRSPRQRKQLRNLSPNSPTSKSGDIRKKITKSSSPPPTHKKMNKTLEGKVAGLQDAKALRDENEKFKKQEKEMFKQMAEKYMDQDSHTARDRKTGRRRNVFEDIEKERKNLMKEDERKKTYSRWGAGLKQIEDFKDRVANETHEMCKPVARYADDKDLEDHLKNQCRDGDPMAEYFRKKQKDISSGPSLPIYQGAFPENRFNIRPGYRWDGVDRSNGYEKKWFDVQSKKKAVEEEAYKYSVEDM